MQCSRRNTYIEKERWVVYSMVDEEMNDSFQNQKGGPIYSLIIQYNCYETSALDIIKLLNRLYTIKLINICPQYN